MFGFDGKRVAKIHDNQLINEEGKNYELHICDKWIEVIDEYDIPILQVDLKKADNSININGVTFDDNGYYTYMLPNLKVEHKMPKPYEKMTSDERSDFIIKFREEARYYLYQLH